MNTTTELNAIAAAELAASIRNNGDTDYAGMPNVVEVLDRFDSLRLGYKLHKAVLRVLEFPLIRGYSRASRDAEFAAQKALRAAQDGAVCAACDFDEDEVCGETRNEGEIDVAERVADELPTFPHESALATYKALRSIVQTAAANIPGAEKQFYPELRPLPAVAEDVVKYQSAAQKARAAEDTALRTAAQAEVTPAQQKVLLQAAQRKLDAAEAFLRKAVGTDKEEEARSSVATAKGRLSRLSGGEDTAPAARTADSVRIAVQDFLNAYKASHSELLHDADWTALPVYIQYACWEGVSDVLALELDRANRSRLTQLFNESDAQYLQRCNERDALQAAACDAADNVLAYAGHWEVLLHQQLRNGSETIGQMQSSLR